MRLLTEKEAAVLLNCSIHTLQKNRRIGGFIPYLKIGRSVRYKRQDIEAYIEQRLYTSTTQYNGGEDV